MPIRINLLAEAQAAEEMRRRDPIKRAVFTGAALVVLMIGWIGITQMNVLAARRELTDLQGRLSKVDDSSKQVRNNQLTLGETEEKLAALDRYASNRFYWGTLLDAIQHTALENIRLVEIQGEQKYHSGDQAKLYATNITVRFQPAPAKWKFWASAGAEPPVMALVNDALKSVTNSGVFATNILSYATKVTPTATNRTAGEAVAKVEFDAYPWAMEKIVLRIRGQDYSNPPGTGIDEFARRINNSPYFKNLLVPVEGFRFTERPPQPRPDPQDPVNPTALFVPFTIELTLKERIFANE